MLGRWAVWPTMFSLFLAMCVDTWIADAMLYFGLALTLWATALDFHTLALIGLYVGLALTLWATALYVRDGRRQARARPSS